MRATRSLLIVLMLALGRGLRAEDRAASRHSGAAALSGFRVSRGRARHVGATCCCSTSPPGGCCRPGTSGLPSVVSRSSRSGRRTSIRPQPGWAMRRSRARTTRPALAHFDRALAGEQQYAPALVGRGQTYLAMNDAGGRSRASTPRSPPIRRLRRSGTAPTSFACRSCRAASARRARRRRRAGSRTRGPATSRRSWPRRRVRSSSASSRSSN